jgi:hypothetical protein
MAGDDSRMAGGESRMAGGESRMTGDCCRADGIRPDIYVPTHTPNFSLANRSTDWQSGQPFGVQNNLLANGKI